MKKYLISLIILASTLISNAGTPIPLNIGWDFGLPDTTNYVYKVYTDTSPTPPGVLLTNVVGVTNCVIMFARPSDQYMYVTASSTNSNPTNYIADSEISNIIRIRVLGNGQVRVN